MERKNFSKNNLPQKRKRNSTSVSKQILNLKQLKWYTGVQSISASTTMTLTDLVSCGIGTGLNERVGSKIRLSELRIRGQALLADTTNTVRIFLFRWLMNNNSDVPGASEVLDSGSDLWSGFTKYSPNRFKVLHDEFIHLDQYHVNKKIKIDLKLDSLATFDSGTNAGIGHIYFGYISDSSAIPHPTVNLDYQLVWRDLE